MPTNKIERINQKSKHKYYHYDALNRITAGWSAANTGNYSWGENYSIDAWGNLQIIPMSGKAHGGNFTLSSSVQNQPTGLSYDAAGNLLAYLSASYVYDQENRLSSTAGMSYTYDGDGERVLKSQTSGGAPVKRYWSMSGNTLAEGDNLGNLTSEYIYFGDQRIARVDLPAGSIHYYLSDHLNSTSMVISAAGAIEEESDFYPFGTEVVVTGPGTNELKFTGKRRDSESQLDYFGGRYYSKAFGRFLTPDPLLNSGHPSDSQSWNRYSYVSNNPLRFTDPTGFWQWDKTKCGANKKECDDYKQKFRDAVAALGQARDKLKEGSTDRTRLDKVLGLIGKENDKGKLHVGFDDNLNYKGIPLTGLTVPNGKGGVHMTLNFALMPDNATVRGAELGHEGQHGVDENGFFHAIKFAFGYGLSNEKRTQWEAQGYRTESSFYRGTGVDDTYNGTPTWKTSWGVLDDKAIESKQGDAARQNAETEVKDLKKKPE